MEVISENAAFGGVQFVCSHASKATGGKMTFALYLPPRSKTENVPLLWYLSGLTCTHENAMVKAGAQAHAAKAGIALAFPDTSPRGEDVADDEAYDLGQGAGFYLNATEAPWAPNFAMWDYISKDLPDLLFGSYPLDPNRQGITGHSMGGHGALTLAMTYPDRYRSVSAFAPIANPTQSDWGKKQFLAYLGSDEEAWRAHDATLLMETLGHPGRILIDQGTKDQFLDLLKPEALSSAMAARRQPAIFRMQPDYDHSYFFVASFMSDHVLFHAEALAA
ncbi:MAG: S-formylglutathione hydrolase [Pseudomonadota bacterium]